MKKDWSMINKKISIINDVKDSQKNKIKQYILDNNIVDTSLKYPKFIDVNIPIDDCSELLEEYEWFVVNIKNGWFCFIERETYYGMYGECYTSKNSHYYNELVRELFIRTRYANNRKRYTKSELNTISTMLDNNESVEKISEVLKRYPNNVATYIKKHFK